MHLQCTRLYLCRKYYCTVKVLHIGIYETETYLTHFLEDAQFPKAPGFSQALSKLLLYAPRTQLTASPPTSQCLGITQLC